MLLSSYDFNHLPRSSQAADTGFLLVMCSCVIWGCVYKSRKKAPAPGSGITGSCEPPVGDVHWGLNKGPLNLVTTESSLQLPSFLPSLSYLPISFFFFFWKRVSLCSLGYPRTHSVDRDLPASASTVLGLNLCVCHDCLQIQELTDVQ